MSFKTLEEYDRENNIQYRRNVTRQGIRDYLRLAEQAEKIKVVQSQLKEMIKSNLDVLPMSQVEKNRTIAVLDNEAIIEFKKEQRTSINRQKLKKYKHIEKQVVEKKEIEVLYIKKGKQND